MSDKRINLCTGESLVSKKFDRKPCIHSEIEKGEYYSYDRNNTRHKLGNEVRVICHAPNEKYYQRFRTHCKSFSNSTLGDF